MRTTKWQIDEVVNVSLPYGEGDRTVHKARIVRIQEPGPEAPHRTIKVLFDDPLLYGGRGYAWVSPDVISLPGTEPKQPDRTDTGFCIG